MKALFRIPAKEMYGFIEIEAEVASVEDALEGYDTAVKLYKGGGEGLDPKMWNMALDTYLTLRTAESGVYERMNSVQQNVMQEIKRAYKRIKSKE